MKLRNATMDDAQMLLNWRNDPLTRLMSRQSSIVDLAGHTAWLSKSLANDAPRMLYIAEEDGEAVGTVRVDIANGECELSWTVNPAFRNRGIGKRMVSAALKGIFKARAEIKPENKASIRIAESCGMLLAGEHDGLLVYRRHS